MVYFNVDTSSKAPSQAGSGFTAGNLAIAGIGGLAIGAIVTALAAKSIGRKKKTQAA